MQFCANNSKTIAFSKIFMASKSVQHDEIYLWAYFEEELLPFLGVFSSPDLSVSVSYCNHFASVVRRRRCRRRRRKLFQKSSSLKLL